MRAAILFLATAALCSPLALGDAERRVDAVYVTDGYYAGAIMTALDVHPSCLRELSVDGGYVDVEATWRAGVGETCFAILPGETRLGVRVSDAAGLGVLATAAFYAGGEFIPYAHGFCDAASLPIPLEATTVIVDVEPVPSIVGCGVASAAGNVSATFS